jgi:hypothetical protein
MCETQRLCQQDYVDQYAPLFTDDSDELIARDLHESGVKEFSTR